ncbi:lipopolysaccharide-induced tumor necrosis factor-alpha factor homolog isoform X1 [Argonauta hians]
MNRPVPTAPVYAQIPLQDTTVPSVPSYAPPVPPYPDDPPPKYEPPKGYQASFPYQPGTQGAYQQPFYPGRGPSYQHGSHFEPQPVLIVRETEFGPESKEMVCPNCQAYIRTATEYEAGALTWVVSGLFCLFCFWSGCCLLPFCIGEMKDVIHICPNCNKKLGIFQRLS